MYRSERWHSRWCRTRIPVRVLQNPGTPGLPAAAKIHWLKCVANTQPTPRQRIARFRCQHIMDLFRIVAVGFLDPAHSESLRDSLACFIAIWLLVKILTMFPRQRWSEVRITAAHLSQHRLAKLLGVSSVGDAPEVASAAGLAHLRRDTAPTPACLADSSAPETPPPLALAGCPPSAVP